MKWFIYLGVFFLFIGNAYGLILVDDLEKGVYNLGDSVQISGYLLRDKDDSGKFELSVDCGKKTVLLMKSINIKRGEKYNFSEALPLFLDVTGKCKILVSFVVNETSVDDTSTEDFVLTSDLYGNFSIENNLIQLGKDITVKGNVKKMDNEPVNGVGLLYFIFDNEISFIEKVNILNGEFDARINTNNNMPGKYTADIEVNDLYGNRKRFDNIFQFTIVNEIPVFVETNKKVVWPEASLTVFGKVNTILRENIRDGIVIINFDNKQFKTNLKKDGEFDYQIEIPNNIRSGKHKIKAIVQDNFGNTGEDETLIDITPIPSVLEFDEIDKRFNPNNNILIKPYLYDQAGDLMGEVVTIKVIDPNKKIVFNKDTKSGSGVEFKFPENSLVGVWKIRAVAGGILKEYETSVDELYALDFEMRNQTLLVKNKGNTKYNGEIKIKMINPDVESTLVKRTSLNPGDVLEINLRREVKTGAYNIEVGDKEFKEIYIVGISAAPYNTIYWVIIIIILLLVCYFFFFRRRRMIIKKIREKRSLLRKKMGDDLEKVKKDIYRNNILRKLEEQERKVTKSLKFNFKKKKGDDGFYLLGRELIRKKEEPTLGWSNKEEKKKGGGDGLFNMFD